ncbi:hypothetical protein CDG61_16385 [Acinetobacter sp. WCHAc010052]|nr:hypothetical protein CDG61_16385 [Acinetobacter sp. WCHAc010052]
MELFRLIFPSDVFTKWLFYKITYPIIKNISLQTSSAGVLSKSKVGSQIWTKYNQNPGLKKICIL